MRRVGSGPAVRFVINPCAAARRSRGGRTVGLARQSPSHWQCDGEPEAYQSVNLVCDSVPDPGHSLIRPGAWGRTRRNRARGRKPRSMRLFRESTGRKQRKRARTGNHQLFFCCYVRTKWTLCLMAAASRLAIL